MSFKVVIIDDNINTVKSLQVSIKWAALGLELVGSAHNGVEGSRLIRQVKPDIIITDINMPEMNGLEMIKLVSNPESNVRIIVISGYDKFQYASQAIKLAVFDYILKPIDDGELKNSLVRAKESIESEASKSSRLAQVEKRSRQVRLLAYLTASETGVLADAAACFAGEKEAAGGYFVIAAQGAEGISRPLLERLEDEKYPGNLSVVSVIFEGFLVLLCSLKKEDAVWHKYAKNIGVKLLDYSPELVVAVSGLHDSSFSARSAFFEARKLLLGQNVLVQKSRILFYDEVNFSQNPRLAESDQMLEKLIIDHFDEAGWEGLKEIIFKNSGGQTEPLRVILMMYCLKVLERKFNQSQWPESVDSLVFGVSGINTPAEAKTWYLDFHAGISSILKQEQGLHQIIRDALNYIRLYAAEGLTLETTAKKFGVSPNYLSSIIHKETGVTYQQHIITAKMNVAKQMLDDSRMKIEDVGYGIGYENYISFYKAFKNTCGMTPSEYRFRSRA